MISQIICIFLAILGVILISILVAIGTSGYTNFSQIGSGFVGLGQGLSHYFPFWLLQVLTVIPILALAGIIVRFCVGILSDERSSKPLRISLNSIFKRRNSRQAISGTLLAFIMILFVMALLFTYLAFGVTSAYNAVTGIFGTSPYNLTDFNFANTIWVWWPIIILFAGIVFVLNAAQQRTPGQDI